MKKNFVIRDSLYHDLYILSRAYYVIKIRKFEENI